jgi:hypothetical protein
MLNPKFRELELDYRSKIWKKEEVGIIGLGIATKNSLARSELFRISLNT